MVKNVYINLNTTKAISLTLVWLFLGQRRWWRYHWLWSSGKYHVHRLSGPENVNVQMPGPENVNVQMLLWGVNVLDWF